MSNPDLNIRDIATIREIIDLASQRGAFRGNELSVVGEIYNKINTFLTTLEEEVKKKQGISSEVDENSQPDTN